jgi:signal transduction histidine kinase
MTLLLAPGRFLMNRLSYVAKFSLIGLLLLLPAGIALSQYLSQTQDDLTTTARENIGLRYYKPLIGLIKDVQRHRGMTTSTLAGYGAFNDQISANEISLVGDLQTLDAVDAKNATALDLTQEPHTWTTLKTHWQYLFQQYKTLTPTTNFDAHTKFIDEVMNYLVWVSNSSGLILDSQAAPYYLIDLLTNDLTDLTEQVAQVRGLGTLLLVQKEANQTAGLPVSEQLRNAIDLSTSRMTSLQSFFDYIYAAEPKIQTLLGSQINAYFGSVNVFLNSALSISPSVTDAAAYFNQGTQAIDYLQSAYNASLVQLEQLFQIRSDGINTQRTVVLTITILAIVLVIYLLYAFYITVRKVISVLEISAGRLKAGEITGNIQLETRDELAQIAVSFNTVGTALIKSNQTLVERSKELEIANALAREASRIKSHFLSTMSHELRTPMNAIIGFTDLLLTEKPGPLSPMQRTFLERAAGNNRRLLVLINDVLDLSRIEAGRMEIHAKPFAPQVMLDRVATQTSSLFSGKGLGFEMHIDPGLPDTILGDQGRIEQVLVNLLSNAVKFTSTGTVTLEAKADYSADTWLVAVTDTGKGIAPHMQDVIFEAFRQIDVGSTRESEGSGLGLAISRELVQMMDGKLTVDSEVGKGSTFTIKLKMASGDKAALLTKTAVIT